MLRFIFPAHICGQVAELPVIIAQRRFGIPCIQPINAHTALRALVPNRHVFYARTIFDHVAHSLQFGNKAIKGVRSGHGKLHILAHHAADGRLAGFAAEPIGIAFPFAVRFYDGEFVFPAEFIGNFADTLIVGGKVIAEHFAVYKGNRIGYDVVMQMSLVQMGGNGAFKAVCQKSARKLAADLMHLLRRSLTGCKALDNMVGQNALVSWHEPNALGFFHALTGSVRVTLKARHIQLVFGFVLILRIG